MKDTTIATSKQLILHIDRIEGESYFSLLNQFVYRLNTCKRSIPVKIVVSLRVYITTFQAKFTQANSIFSRKIFDTFNCRFH